MQAYSGRCVAMNFLKKAANVLLIILLALSSVGAVICGSALSLTDISSFNTAILTADFYDKFTSNIRDTIDFNSSVVDIGTDGAMEAIDELKLKEYINKYTVTLTNNMVSGSNESYSASFDSAELYNYIKLQFEKYKDEISSDSEYLPTASHVNDAYDTLMSEINGTLDYLPEAYFTKAMSYIDAKLTEKTGGHFTLEDFYNLLGDLDQIFIVFLIISVLTMIAIVLLNCRRLSSGVFKIGSTLFFSSVALFVPSLTIRLFDISSRLCLADSPLGFYATTFIHTVEKAFFVGTIIFLGVSLVVMLAGAASWIISARKNNRMISEIERLAAIEKANEENAPEDVQVLL